MAKVKNKDTKPEIMLRSILHKAGFRFRKNAPNLPGKPDIVMPKFNTIIFVHGCFWHRHNCKRGQSVPSARMDYWLEKFRTNVVRDKDTISKLTLKGWRVLVVWECELKHSAKLLEKIKSFLIKEYQLNN